MQIFSFNGQKSESTIQYHILPCYKLESGTEEDVYEKSLGDPEHLHDGIGVDLDNGSLVIEMAHKEWHASSRVERPDEKNPSRISVVFFQHNGLHLANHGRGDP